MLVRLGGLGMFTRLGAPIRAGWARKAKIGIALAAAAAAGVGVARAGGIGGGGLFPFPGGPYPTVVGCAHNGNGDLRVVAAASDCAPNEHVVTFAGPQAPQIATVDCGAGGSLNDAINSAILNLPLTVNVKGTCVESNIIVNRDWVALQPVSPGDGIQGSLSLVGAHHIYLSGLTITDSGTIPALNANNGSSFEADNTSIKGNSVILGQASDGVLNQPTIQNAGISALEDSSVTVAGGTISGNGDLAVNVDGAQATLSGVTITTSKGGVGVVNGGNARLLDDMVENNRFYGVTARNGGSVVIDGGSVSSNGGTGVGAMGSSVEIDGNAQIASNGFDGVAISDGGRVSLQPFTPGGNMVIANNTGNGVELQDASLADFGGGPAGQITGNGGWGVFCHAAPSVAMTTGNPSAWTISGNTTGGNNCPNAT
jgi:Right handed beta helix region